MAGYDVTVIYISQPANHKQQNSPDIVQSYDNMQYSQPRTLSALHNELYL